MVVDRGEVSASLHEIIGTIGRDIKRQQLQERGTWMGVSKNKKFAVLTNYLTHYSELQKNPKSRGENLIK